MTSSSDPAQVVRFVVPLPPVSLRANNRTHWATKKKDADRYSEDVFADTSAYGASSTALHTSRLIHQFPWPSARVVYTWRYAGAQPDHGNLGGNVKYLQDIICMRPKNTKPGYKRWHLGLVDDDKHITAEYRMEKVAHRSDECVVVELYRKDEDTTRMSDVSGAERELDDAILNYGGYQAEWGAGKIMHSGIHAQRVKDAIRALIAAAEAEGYRRGREEWGHCLNEPPCQPPFDRINQTYPNYPCRWHAERARDPLADAQEKP